MTQRDYIPSDEELISYLEGELDAEASARLEAQFAASPGAHDELEAYRTIIRDLEAFGAAHRRHIEPVDMLDAVMDAVAAESRPSNVVRLPRPAARFRWVGYAAAALLLVAASAGVFWFGYYAPSRTHVPRPVAVVPPEPREESPAPDTPAVPEQVQVATAKLDEVKRALGEVLAKRPRGPMESVDAPPLSDITLKDLASELNAASSADRAWSALMQWATLTPELAVQIAASAAASPEAVVGAAEMLPPEEAGVYLMTVVGRMPESPHARIELAQALAASAIPDAQQKALAEIDAASQLASENALPLYLKARLLLEAGDIDGALAALEEAAQYENASAMVQESAESHEQALIAGGMEPQTAQVLAALTAGVEEHGELTGLSEELLAYAQYYADLGNLDAARRVAEAVQRFGEQLDAGALFAQERLAGLDMQRAAVDVLEGFYTALSSFEDIELLTTQTMDLVSDFQGMAEFFDGLDALLTGASEDFLATIGDLILGYGDMNLFDMLGQLGLLPGGDGTIGG